MKTAMRQAFEAAQVSTSSLPPVALQVVKVMKRQDDNRKRAVQRRKATNRAPAGV